MSRRLDPRSVQRVMAAASSIQVDSHREAAILGGIVRSLVDRGSTLADKGNYSRHASSALMSWAAPILAEIDDADCIAPAPVEPIDGRPVTQAEWEAVCRRFSQAYIDGDGMEVAA